MYLLHLFFFFSDIRTNIFKRTVSYFTLNKDTPCQLPKYCDKYSPCHKAGILYLGHEYIENLNVTH